MYKAVYSREVQVDVSICQRAAAAVRIAEERRLKLGDISIHRKLGWPPECAKAMWTMLEHDRTEDFVIASGGDQ